MNEPIDVATAETLAFLTVHLPRAARMIEVGCGEGRLALALQDRGYRVTGLDSDRETVARAEACGAPVTQAIWPEFESAPVDAIAFTRSLHHIGPLQRAVQKAAFLARVLQDEARSGSAGRITLIGRRIVGTPL